MSGFWTDGAKTFEASADLAEKRRVTIDTSLQLAYAGASALGDGVVMAAVKSGEFAAVELFNKTGTLPMSAAGAIGAGADVYAAANGQVQALPAAAGDYVKVGKNVGGAVSAAGEIAEILVTPDAGTVTTVV